MHENSLVGTWLLHSAEVRSADETTYPWGQDATGQLLYSADGHMSVMIVEAHRPPFATPDLRGGSQEELARAARSCTAYAGRYERRGDSVVHHVEASLFPNWVGMDQVRFVELNGDQLTLRTPPEIIRSQERTAIIVWQRPT